MLRVFVDGDGVIAGTKVISRDPKLSQPYTASPGYEDKD